MKLTAREAAFCLLNDNGTNDHLLYLRLAKPAEARTMLQKISGSAEETSVYKDLRIAHTGKVNLAAELFGPIFRHFGPTFYAQINDCLLIGNTAGAVRRAVDCVDRGEVLKNQTGPEAEPGQNMRLTINCLQFWEIAAEQTEPAALAGFNDYKSEWLHFREFRADLRTSGERYFPLVGQIKHLRSMVSADKIRPVFAVDLGSPAESRPYLLPGSSENDYYAAVRNRAGRLFLADAGGKKKWSLMTEGPLCARPEQLFFKAGGAPYFVFAGPKKIRPVNLEGKSPGGFPLNLPEGATAKHFSVIDYDGSGNYRLAVTDAAGGLRLFSKFGSPVKNWAPRDLSAPQTGNLQHLRIGTEDYLLTISEKGQLEVLLRSGQSAPGFPLDFAHRPAKPLFWAAGKTLADSYAEWISAEGERIRVSLGGRVLSRQALGKQAEEAEFGALPDENDPARAIFYSRHNDHLRFYGADNEELFRFNLPAKAKFELLYANFAADAEIIVLFLPQSALFRIFRPDGKELLAEGLPAGTLPALRYSAGRREFTFFYGEGKSLKATAVLNY